MSFKLGLVISVFALLACIQGDDKYTTKYDNVNVDEILKSERLLNSYINCLLEKGPCTPDALELKKNLPDALETKCEKCSEAQKNTVHKVMNHVSKNKIDSYDAIKKKYDPENKYFPDLEATFT